MPRGATSKRAPGFIIVYCNVIIFRNVATVSGISGCLLLWTNNYYQFVCLTSAIYFILNILWRRDEFAHRAPYVMIAFSSLSTCYCTHVITRLSFTSILAARFEWITANHSMYHSHCFSNDFLRTKAIQSAWLIKLHELFYNVLNMKWVLWNKNIYKSLAVLFSN